MLINEIQGFRDNLKRYSEKSVLPKVPFPQKTRHKESNQAINDPVKRYHDFIYKYGKYGGWTEEEFIRLKSHYGKTVDIRSIFPLRHSAEVESYITWYEQLLKIEEDRRNVILGFKESKIKKASSKPPVEACDIEPLPKTANHIDPGSKEKTLEKINEYKQRKAEEIRLIEKERLQKAISEREAFEKRQRRVKEKLHAQIYQRQLLEMKKLIEKEENKEVNKENVKKDMPSENDIYKRQIRDLEWALNRRQQIEMKNQKKQQRLVVRNENTMVSRDPQRLLQATASFKHRLESKEEKQSFHGIESIQRRAVPTWRKEI
jgi:hypothetical protein